MKFLQQLIQFNGKLLKYPISPKFNMETLINHFCDLPVIFIFTAMEIV